MTHSKRDEGQLGIRRLAGATVVMLMLVMAGCGREGSAEAEPDESVPEVGVLKLALADVTLRAELPGRVVALRSSQVRPQVTGIVRRRLFEEGALVKAGQTLYELDAAGYQAAYALAEANLAKSQAKAASLGKTAKRHADLMQSEGISRQAYEDAESEYVQAQAEVRAATATLASTKVDLNHTLIKAPISGRIGRSSVSEGALVSQGQETALASIVQLDAVYVDMVQPSQDLVRLKQQQLDGGLQLASTQVQLKLEDGSPYRHAGVLRFNEVSVDEASGAVTLRARFPNPDGLLMPGMYVKAEVQQGVIRESVLVPNQGIEQGQGGQVRVLLVDAANKVDEQHVQAHVVAGGQWLVSKGLKAGDRVIVEGRKKVVPGQLVKTVSVR